MQTQDPTYTNRPASPTNNEEEEVLQQLTDVLVNLLDFGPAIHEAVNLVMTRRPMLERAIGALTIDEIRSGDYRSLAEEIVEEVFCDDVNQSGQVMLDLCRNIVMIFLTVRSDRKIAIIKEMRAITGLNLKDSKTIVDKIFASPVKLPPSLKETFGMTEELRQKVRSYEQEMQDLRAELSRTEERLQVTQDDCRTQRKVTAEAYKKLDASYVEIRGLEEVIRLATDYLELVGEKRYDPFKTIVQGAALAVREKAQKDRTTV